MKRLLVLALAISLLAGCNKDDENNKDLTPEEAQVALDQMAMDMDQDVIDLMESEGTQGLQDLLNLAMDSESLFGEEARLDASKQKFINLGRMFAQKPIQRMGGSVEDDIPSGLYEWDTSKEDFIKDESFTTDDLIIKFPVDGSSTNNGVFTLEEFSVTKSDLPSRLLANITVDDQKVVEVDLTVGWTEEEMPETADLVLFIQPFTLQVSIDLSGSNNSFYTSLHNDGTLITEVDLTVVMEDDFPSELNGSVTYRAVSIQGSINTGDMDEAFGESTDPNEYMDLKLYVNGNFAGDIILVKETNDDDYDDYVPYVEFKDGTQKSLEEVLEPVIESIEEELESLE